MGAEQMDYKKLLEPYGENGRTLEGQILWLKKKGLDETTIMEAIENVYFLLDQGKQFENGHEFDMFLLETARSIAIKRASVLIDNIQGSVIGRFFKGMFKKK